MSTGHRADRSALAAGDPATDEEIAKELDALRARLDAAATTNIGFPATANFDYSALAPFFAGYMLNNLGDPYSDGAYPMHTKPMEREVVDLLADLFQAPVGDRWGYVAAGATEGTEYALHLASTLHPDAIVYHSVAAHHSVTNVISRLNLTSIAIRTDALGEIDYDDLADQVNQHRSRAPIVVANIGTAVTEAVDDVCRITEVLDQLAVRRRWIHADAALAGIPLALLDPDDRPPFDFAAGTDSVVTSGHKFLGAPTPCAVVLVRNSHRLAHARAITYTGSPDTTVANSRSGLAALVMWYAFRKHGLAGLRARAERARLLAAAAHESLREIGWPAHRHRHALTVSFPTPPAVVSAKWVLATHGDTSLIVCMPGVTADQIDEFVADLRAAISPAGAPTSLWNRAPAQRLGTASGQRPLSVPAQRAPAWQPRAEAPAGFAGHSRLVGAATDMQVAGPTRRVREPLVNADAGGSGGVAGHPPAPRQPAGHGSPGPEVAGHEPSRPEVAGHEPPRPEFAGHESVVHESVGRLPTGHAGGPTDARHPLLQPPSVPMPLASPQRKKLLRRAGTPIRL